MAGIKRQATLSSVQKALEYRVETPTQGIPVMSAPPNHDGWVLVAICGCVLVAVLWWAAIIMGAVG